ncbi:hypothetical protein ACFQQB_38665 [Nonomuraea rubra]|uniref:hypothetical protein n=1 Tax=Nonomuraea rubra TaxID=46180 RepID=UPI00361E1CEE
MSHRKALAARAVLPGLLAGAWTALALTGLAAGGAMAQAGSAMAQAVATAQAGGAWWWLFGPLAAPALAAAALRMARRAPVDHSMPVIDTPGGAIPTGPLFWAATGPDLALLGCLPTAAALASQPAPLAPFLVAQGVMSVAVLAGFLWRASLTKARQAT